MFYVTYRLSTGKDHYDGGGSSVCHCKGWYCYLKEDDPHYEEYKDLLSEGWIPNRKVVSICTGVKGLKLDQTCICMGA